LDIVANFHKRLASFRYLCFRVRPEAGETFATAIPPIDWLAEVLPPAIDNNPSFRSFEVLSPDGTKIAHNAQRHEDIFNTVLVYDIKSRKNIACGKVIAPSGFAWSPDSIRFAVVGSGYLGDRANYEHDGWVHIF